MNDLTRSKIERLMKSHFEMARQYQYCASFMGEQYLSNIFMELAVERKKMGQVLARFLNFPKRSFYSFNLFFNSSWRYLKIFLMADQPQKCLGICLENEASVLSFCEEIVWTNDLPEELFRYLTCHQQNIKDAMRNIRQISMSMNPRSHEIMVDN